MKLIQTQHLMYYSKGYSVMVLYIFKWKSEIFSRALNKIRLAGVGYFLRLGWLSHADITVGGWLIACVTPHTTSYHSCAAQPIITGKYTTRKPLVGFITISIGIFLGELAIVILPFIIRVNNPISGYGCGKRP